MKRYFLAYEVPQAYAHDEAMELEFSNRIDNALELVPTIAMDATPLRVPASLQYMMKESGFRILRIFLVRNFQK